MRWVLLIIIALAFGFAACSQGARPAPTEPPPKLGPWSKYSGNPVLGPGPSGTWDSGDVHAPSVLRQGDRYLMWYDGTAGDDPYWEWSIGLATSPDGLAWSKHPANPVLRPGPPAAWDSASVHDPRVVFADGRYYMWYSGFDGTSWRIGYASSPDGIAWEKHPQNPVLDLGIETAWDGRDVAYSSVVMRDGTYHMWYQGRDARGPWRIGYATSENGIAWKKHPENPVLGPGPPESWDQRSFTPHALRLGSWYLLGYTGDPEAGIGYAVSPDGVRWSKAAENPALRPEQAPAWDGAQLLTLTLLQDGTRLRMWYAGSDGGRLHIGTASAPLLPQVQRELPLTISEKQPSF